MRYGIALGVIVIAAVTAFSILHNNGGSAEVASTAAATAAPTTTASSSGVTLMQSTGTAFASSPDYQYAHEVYPTAASGAAKALSSLAIQKTALAGGAYRIALTNGTAGPVLQSVTVAPGQSVYFVERGARDDSGHDAFMADDHLVAVDAQGDILQ